MKRLFDLFASFIGLMLLGPLMPIICIMIRGTTTGPALFRQNRVGRYGRDFTLYKFRTMTVAPGAEQGWFEAGSSARVTPFGSFLRATKLDELPQLWNVLTGDMSLVGPRPEVRKWVEAYPARWARVHAVCPGITDPAAIIYRHEEDMLAQCVDPEGYYRDCILPNKLTIYEDYLKTRSFWGDFNLILLTLRSVLLHRRAPSDDGKFFPNKHVNSWRI